MSPYRTTTALSKLPPRTPWWRLLRARLDGTLIRIETRRIRHDIGMVRDPEEWARRGLGREFTDAEIDAVLPRALRKEAARHHR